MGEGRKTIAIPLNTTKLSHNTPGRDRTFIRRLRRPVLIQLSYRCVFTLMRRPGVEPGASPLSAECSANELPARGIHAMDIELAKQNQTDSDQLFAFPGEKACKIAEVFKSPGRTPGLWRAQERQRAKLPRLSVGRMATADSFRQ